MSFCENMAVERPVMAISVPRTAATAKMGRSSEISDLNHASLSLNWDFLV